MPMPVTQKPSRRAPGSSCASATAGLLGHRHRHLHRLEPDDARRRPPRRRAGRRARLRPRRGGRRGVPRAAVAATALQAGRRRRRGCSRDRGRDDAMAAAGRAGAARRRGCDRRGLDELARHPPRAADGGGPAMTMWTAILLGGIAVVGLKLVGYLVPKEWLERPRPARITDLLTVALLAALVAVQTIGDGMALRVDARLPAVAVAALLLWRRAPFLVVVVAAAGTAALLRWLGWAA